MKFPKLKKPKKRTAIIIGICALILIAIIIIVFVGKAKSKKANNALETTAVVSRGNVVSSITGSSSVQPKDQYSITSLVSGNILSANFEQGDVVQEGDVLYRIDSSDVENNIESANLSVQKSQNNYNKAVTDANDLTVRSDASGVVKTLYIKKGDNVASGTKVADIYDDSVMLLTVPFNESDVANITTGQSAVVHVAGTADTLNGNVSEIKNASYAKSGNMIVRDVVIRVNNPGTLMPEDSATATVGNIACNDTGKFEYVTERTISAKASGTVASINVREGNRISSGSVVAQLSSSTITDNITSQKLSLRESQLTQKNATKKLEDYTITAPISGTVVEKNIKAGDKLDTSNMSTVMAVIYDMSGLEFELPVDELDIKNVALGQSVTITSDALEGKTYHGTVTAVNVNGTTENGVTTYPVTVEINDFDDELLPGMNIDAEIITSNAEDVLCVPVSAVNRGNVVYVKGEKTDKSDRAPEGYRSVTVETGIFNDEMIEIVSGLSEGDEIYVQRTQSSTATPQDMMGAMGGMGGMPGGGMGGAPGGGMGGAPGGGNRGGNGGGNRGGGMR